MPSGSGGNTQANLRKRSGVFQARFQVRGRRVERSLHTRSLAEARERLAYLRALYTAGRQFFPTDIRVDVAIAKYAEYLQARRTGKSAQSDLGRLRRFRAVVPMRTLGELSVEMLAEFLQSQIAAGLSPKTVNEYKVAVGGLFNYALRYLRYRPSDALFPNPAGAIKRYPVPETPVVHLKPKQVEQQLKALSARPDIRAAVATMIFAGLRRSETLWLLKEDLALDGPHPHILIRTKNTEDGAWTSKTRRNRVVPIAYELLPVLRQHLAKQSPEVAWAFPSPGGRRWRPGNFSTHLRKIQREHDLPWRCGAYRRTFGTSLAKSGVSDLIIAKLMGNSPAVARKHYIDLSLETLAEAVNPKPYESRTDITEQPAAHLKLLPGS